MIVNNTGKRRTLWMWTPSFFLITLNIKHYIEHSYHSSELINSIIDACYISVASQQKKNPLDQLHLHSMPSDNALLKQHQNHLKTTSLKHLISSHSKRSFSLVLLVRDRTSVLRIQLNGVDIVCLCMIRRYRFFCRRVTKTAISNGLIILMGFSCGLLLYNIKKERKKRASL